LFHKVDAPLDQVWSILRDFTSAQKLFHTVESVTIEDNLSSTAVGAVRQLKFKNGGVIRRQRLLEVSDVHHRISWEQIPSDKAEGVESVVQAVLSTVELHRITENNTTYVSWSADFSADVVGSYVVQEQQDYAANLKDVKQFFAKKH